MVEKKLEGCVAVCMFACVSETNWDLAYTVTYSSHKHWPTSILQIGPDSPSCSFFSFLFFCVSLCRTLPYSLNNYVAPIHQCFAQAHFHTVSALGWCTLMTLGINHKDLGKSYLFRNKNLVFHAVQLGLLWNMTFVFKSDLTAVVTASCEELVPWAACGSHASVGSLISTWTTHAENVQAVGRCHQKDRKKRKTGWGGALMGTLMGTHAWLNS